jgi:hypothetical protein
MLKIELYNHDANGDPAPSFPSDAEIALAEQLRHQLEERYLTPSAPWETSPRAAVLEDERHSIDDIHYRSTPTPVTKRRQTLR